MKITATSQPQAIYPDGLQHELVITNEGPSTLWVGSDSATSIAQSMPVPPLSSVAWAAGIPLWVVAEFNTNARIDHATDAPVSAGAGLIKTLQEVASGTSKYEVGAYSSIEIIRPFDSTDIPGSGGQDGTLYQFTLTWITDDGSGAIARDIVDVYAGNANAVVVRDVLARYVTISVTRIGFAGNGNSIPLAVFGSTIKLPERSSMEAGRATYARGSIAIGYAVRSLDHTNAFAVALNNPANYAIPGRFYLPCEGKRIYVTGNLSAFSSASSIFRFIWDLGGGNEVPFYSLSIPSGSAEFGTPTTGIVVPRGGQIYGRFENSLGAGVTINLTVMWTD